MSALNKAREDLYFHEHSATCQKDSICLEAKQFCAQNDEGLVALTVSGRPSELEEFRAPNGAIYLNLDNISGLILRLDEGKFRELCRYLKDAYDHLIYLHLQKDGLDICRQNLPNSLVYPVRLANEHVNEFARHLRYVRSMRIQ